MMTMSAMVRSISYGAEVEDYLDKKLDRRRSEQITVPSFIADDPDFAPDPSSGRGGSAGEDEAEVSTHSIASGGSNVTIGSATLGSAGPYLQLSDGAKELDVMLYNILQMSVTGSKNILISCCGGISYIKAMCVLARHADISRNDRMTQAFTTMDNLKFNGDVRIWQTDAVSAIRELLDSQASIMHYMLTRVMHSFKGNLKTVQYQIADEINSTTIDDKYNIFDMVQNVATDIASVGDSTRTQKVNAVKGNGKRGSKKGGKKESSKGAGKESQKDNGKKGSGIPGVAGPGSQCHNCGEFGHFERDCTKPKKSFSAPAEAPAIQAAANSSQLPLSDQIASGLAALQKQLQAHSQCHVVASPYQNATGGWAYRGQRIGEAKHPGPSTVTGYGSVNPRMSMHAQLSQSDL